MQLQDLLAALSECNSNSLSVVAKHIDYITRTDIIARLPLELAHKVLGFLDAESLVQ